MNKIAEIKPLVTRTYTFPLQEAFEELPPAQRLADDEWKPLPERFLEGVEFVSRFTGSDINDRSATYLPLAHVMGEKASATDNKTLVEYDLGGRHHSTCTLPQATCACFGPLASFLLMSVKPWTQGQTKAG